MSSSLRRGTLAAAAIAFSIASLAACGVGHHPQTLEVKPDVAATAVGDVKIQNAMVITQPKLESKGPAVISATLFNNGRSAQTLDAVTLGGSGATAELKPAHGSGKLTVPAHGSVVLGGKGNASAVLPVGREAVQAGNVQPVTFTFSRTGAVKVSTFVVPAKTYFSKWGPSELPKTPAKPSKSASPDGSGSPSGAPTGSESKSPSGSATGSTAGTGSSGTPRDASSASATTSTGG